MRGYLIAEAPHQIVAMRALERGMQAHGDEPTTHIAQADFVAVWGARARIPHEFIEAGTPRLYLEAGYINGTGGSYVQNRLRFISLNWDGMHGFAQPTVHRAPGEGAPLDRWHALGIELKPWRRAGMRALVLAQHGNDAAAIGAQYAQLERQLTDYGYTVTVRPHPLEAKAAEPLERQLAETDLAVTYASTAAVEAVIAGVPTVCLSAMAIAWPVSSHYIGAQLYAEDRLAWAADLAYRQWTLEELASGDAWGYYRRYRRLGDAHADS